jgi:hypothetical protein
MNNRLLPSLLFVFLLCVGQAFGQDTTPQGAASDATNKKIYRLNLLIKLVPLVLKKEQFDPLLAALDKAKELKVAEQIREDKILADLDPGVTDAVNNAVEKGIYPPRDYQLQIQKQLDAVANKQVIVGVNMVKIVTDAVNATLNEGQKKTMSGSFASAYINSANPASVTDEVKLAYYIRVVLLDAETYNLLKEMSKHAS